MVPQTDLVPTLALLLGVPIPYSNVGQVLLPLFPPHEQTEGAVGGLSQLEALWINTKQVCCSAKNCLEHFLSICTQKNLFIYSHILEPFQELLFLWFVC